MTNLKTAVVTLAALAAAAQVWATEVPRDRTAELAQAKKELARVSNQTRGAHRAVLQLEQRKLQGLIDDLESGRRVDPAEIDRAIEDAEHDAR